MINPNALAILRSFRQELYDDLGLRQDSLFELVDAVLTAPERRTLVRLSLCPCFRRRWSSTCDALADGTLDVDGLRALFQARVPLPGPGERPLWVVDGTHWPRPAAATSPDRTYEYRPLPGKPQQGVVPAWAYQWLVDVPEVDGSWVLPLDVQRRGPTAGTPTQVAIRQIAAARAGQAPDAPRPVVGLDSGYDVGQLAQAHLDADLVVRLAKHRVFFHAPGPYPGRGRPATHGPPFKLKDARTHGPPDQSATLEHPVYGSVTVEVWTSLHTQAAPGAPFTVLRVQVEHLPATAPRRRCGWPGSAADCLRTCTRSGAGTCAASPSSTPSGLANRPSAGPAFACGSRRRPTAGPGWWPPPCGSSGWPGPWWPTSGCPGSGRCRPSASRRVASAVPSPDFWSP